MLRVHIRDALRTCQHQVPWRELLLMAEILHQLIGSLSHCLQGFIHPRWCRISAINNITGLLCCDEHAWAAGMANFPERNDSKLKNRLQLEHFPDRVFVLDLIKAINSVDSF